MYVLYTGSVHGTYYKIAGDISRACPRFDFEVISTQGSLENLNNLITRHPVHKGYRIAMVQDDALSSIIGPRAKQRATIKHIMAMYNEDITIVVSRSSNIHSLLDLSGKRVAVGALGSGTWFTSASIRTAVGIDWVPVETSPEESILSVLTGDVDAMFLVGGHPLMLLSELGSSVKNDIEILNIKEELSYVRSKLSANVYQWQDREVDLRTVRSSLISATDVPQPAVIALRSCISAALPSLRRWGHTKWKDVKSPLSSKK